MRNILKPVISIIRRVRSERTRASVQFVKCISRRLRSEIVLIIRLYMCYIAVIKFVCCNRNIRREINLYELNKWDIKEIIILVNKE